MDLDPIDGLPFCEVGEWALEKHERLKRYIDITRAVRRKFVGCAGATYLDLFSATGRARIRETGEIVDGSPLVAHKAATSSGVPFSEVHIADFDPTFVEAAKTRLQTLRAPVTAHVGPAEQTVDEIAALLSPYAFHFAFLDPYNLGTLPFTVIKRLAAFRHIDLLIHVSAQDLQRNFGKYFGSSSSPLNHFAPGWRAAVDPNAPERTMRLQVFHYWLSLIRSVDMEAAEGIELVTGGKNQNLYWLVFVSRHPKAHELWEKIRNVSGQRGLPF